MSALRSSVLIIGHSNPRAVAFGADFATSLADARAALKDFSYPVLVFQTSAKFANEVLSLLEFANSASPLSQRVIIQSDTPADTLRQIVNLGSVFRILPSFEDSRFERTIQEALEEYHQLRQNSNLIQLANEQNERLKKLTADLEERVEARRKSLEDAKAKVLVSNARVEALHRALVAIHRAGSIGEMEQLINDALSGALGLIWTRILFQAQARMDARPGLAAAVALHTAALTRGKDVLGHIHFARPSDQPFTRDESGFLGRVADAVAMATDRLTKLDQSETLKHQWEATFDAIADPVSLISQDLEILRINRSFADRSGAPAETIIGKKCHEVLFGRVDPCLGCAIAEGFTPQQKKAGGANFRLKPARLSSGQNAIYDVFSQRIESPVRLGDAGPLLYVNMYHDVSMQLRAERQILESAKMAELGTIGSSIAHELNNPLGGMLSFLQLIKMDLKGTEKYYDDIIEMEKGAQRCRDIVRSLLGFTRKSTHESNEVFDLREAIAQALQITELQTRSVGITVVQNLPATPVEVRGEFNALAQALRHFLQKAHESIAERQKNTAPGATKIVGEIQLSIIESSDETDASTKQNLHNNLQENLNEKTHTSSGEIKIEIRDNGTGVSVMPANATLDAASKPHAKSAQPLDHTSETLSDVEYTVVSQIIHDHGGKIETRSNKGVGSTAIISIPRPVFDP